MAQTATLAEHLVQVIEHYPGCGLDELVMFCPDYTWNQIFLEVDRLSRSGHLQLVQIGRGRYAVSAVIHQQCCPPQSCEAPFGLRTLTRSGTASVNAVAVLWSGRSTTKSADGVAFSAKSALSQAP